MSDTTGTIHALNCLSLVAGQMKPHTVGYLTGFEPVRDDIREFQDELIILAGALDRVIEARGAYLESLGIINAAQRRAYFTNVSMKAIEASALFCIESGIERRIEERNEAYA